MNREELFRTMGELDEDLVLESTRHAKRRPMGLWVAAACLVLGLGVSAGIWNMGRSALPLERSEGVRISYVETAPQASAMAADLMELTEEELFTRFDTLVFRGTVEKLQNIQLKFGNATEYRALATIRVDTVYRGSATDSVSVLLPCSIGQDVWVEDTDTVSAMQVGTTGIFMPMAYDADSTWEENGATLYLNEIADYGFADGERYAFLEGRDGLIFARWAYPSLAGATSLEEVEHFVRQMAGQ